MAMKLVIAAFPEGATVPKLHTCEGADLSPALEWSGAPAGTKSFALIVDDPDAPGGTWNHWLLFNVPASEHAIAQGLEPGKLADSGANDFGKPGYNGPCPPRGHGTHRYFFKLFALDVPRLNLKPGASRAELDRAMRGHIIGQAQYIGRYERK